MLLNLEGLITDTIIDVAKRKRVNKIVIGTKGASGVQEIIFGSNTAKVIHHSKCPVLAIPEGDSYKPIKRITYATDYHASDIGSLKKLLETAKLYHAKITILHVSEEEFSPETERDFLKQFSEKVKKKFAPERMLYKLIFGKNIEKRLEEYIKINYEKLKIRLIHSEKIIEGLNDYCEKLKTNWLVMAPEKHDLFDKVFEPSASKTKKMCFHSRIPLVAIPDFYNVKNSSFWEKHEQVKEHV